MPITSTSTGSTATPNIGRQPQPALANQKSMMYEMTIPNVSASWNRKTNRPRNRAGTRSVVYMGAPTDAPPTPMPTSTRKTPARRTTAQAPSRSPHNTKDAAHRDQEYSASKPIGSLTSHERTDQAPTRTAVTASSCCVALRWKSRTKEC